MEAAEENKIDSKAPERPKLGYWKTRGLSSAIRYQLAYCGVDYEMVEYQHGDDGSKDDFRGKKDSLGMEFPNLPYFIDGDVKLSEHFG